MTFDDIFKKSFLRAMNTGDISIKNILFVLLITSILAAYLFIIYRVITRKTFYNKNFNISISVISIIVAAIIITIQSSIVVSLGMVGALSIVRFRTAIKDPMDLVFLFWSISIGIICGAGLPGVAVLASLVITAGVFILNAVPIAKAPILLIVNAENKEVKDSIIDVVAQYAKSYHVKSQSIKNEELDIIIEIRTKKQDALIASVSSIDGVVQCSLLSHDGEVTF